MKKRIVLFLLCAFFFACSRNSFNIEKDNVSGNQKIIVCRDESSMPILEVAYSGDKENALKLVPFIDSTLLRFYPYVNQKEINTLRVPFNSDYYSFFYTIGTYLFADWKNELLKYGVIEIEWADLIKDLKNNKNLQNGPLTNEFSQIFKIKEIDDVLMKYQLSDDDLRQVYAYTVNYLLKEITFVSIQEFYSREERYFNLSELENIFTRIVIIPESEEFTRYLIGKYGKNTVIKLAGFEFNNDNWQKTVGEKINDTEGDFSKEIENYSFKDIFKDQYFMRDLNKYLKLYNKTTKQTLFKK